MFMKFLLTVAVVAIIWFGFKHLQRMSELKEKRAEKSRLAPNPRRDPAPDSAEDLVQCRVCGTWQPSRNARSCGRRDCPY